MAAGGREPSWIQNRVSHALIWDRIFRHSPRRSHASGGGEIVRTPGCWVSPENSGGSSVVQ